MPTEKYIPIFEEHQNPIVQQPAAQLPEAPKAIEESLFDPIKSKLCPELFNDKDQLKPEVKEYLLDTYNKWHKQFLPGIEIKQVFLIGSSASYQYSDTSDIDIHPIVDITKSQADKIENLPNDTFLPGTKHPVQYYIEVDMKMIDRSPTAYDMLENRWYKKPSIEKPKVPYTYVSEIAKLFMVGIDNRIAEYESDIRDLEYFKQILVDREGFEYLELDENEIKGKIKIKEEEILADLDAIRIGHRLLYSFRSEAFTDTSEENAFLIDIKSKNPNFSINSAVYKILEKYGYFERMKKYEDIRKAIKKEREKPKDIVVDKTP